MLPCFVKPFTYWQIKKILLNDFWIVLQRQYTYKGNRGGQPNKYVLLHEDGTLAYNHEVTLDILREYLTKEGYDIDYK